MNANAKSDFAIYSQRVVLPDRTTPATLRISAGMIREIAIGRHEDPDLWDLGDLVLSPGLIDSHVHVNEPGRTEWEGFSTATRAAAAGGITSIVDMPLNSIPATTTREALELKRRHAQPQGHVDIGFWGGLVPGNQPRLRGLWDSGVLGFKCFLAPSGVDEFKAVSYADIENAAPFLSETGSVLLVHAEDPSVLRFSQTESAASDTSSRSYQRYLASRPPEVEEQAVKVLIDLSADRGIRIHIVHLANAGLLDQISKARSSGVAITVETCPHYLTFSSEQIQDGATVFKCAPPIRSRHHREGLWDGLRNGAVDLIATDHSPSPPVMKKLQLGDFQAAWGGIASLQLLLPAVWTEASIRGFALTDLARWTSSAPATLAGLSHRKGRIQTGYDADFVIWDPEARFVVQGERLEHRHPTTPWEGSTLQGVVQFTLLRGRTVYSKQEGFTTPLSGQLLSR